jgi:hypothetical protein
MKSINNRILHIAKFAGLAAMVAISGISASARENVGIKPKNADPDFGGIAGKKSNCLPATQRRDLDVNNVRTTILNGGDMWWNLSNARYEVPKVEDGQVAKHSLFSGALWIGGVTNGSLKLAAQTYRQSGNDFYPGPLVVGTAATTPELCKRYDRIYRVTKRDIEDFIAASDKITNAPIDIIEWPAHPNENDPVGIAPKLAPFYDADGNGVYEPANGDYPTLNDGNPDIANIPDMMVFTIYNDNGNIHNETNSMPIGLEFHMQAFAYSTNNEINNMTFYRTTIFNRSNERLDSTVFGQWVDPDLGNYADDYIECDVNRNLGICYNGDDNDEGILGYGLNPPSVGVVFFEGPRDADSNEIGLTKFVYYNNDWSADKGNPNRPEHYWNYLNGRWRDGAQITYGGDGRGLGSGATSNPASFMFPGSTDPGADLNNPNSPWTERIAGNTPFDRRFLQTAGSFTLRPGAVNRVTIGIVWARASSGGATGSFNLLKQASDKATALFRNNFYQKEGPPAPKLEVTELDKKIILRMSQTKAVESYVDTFAGPCNEPTIYKFQGYQIWQLKKPNIPSDINDPSEARLITQFDIVDGVSRVVNTVFDNDLEENVKTIMVDGQDKGIQHSIEITKDLFETGSDQTLVNFKNYYFYIVAYATATNCIGDFEQYLASSKTIGLGELLRYTATPHDPSAKLIVPNSTYGTGVPITMVEGVGNGGRVVRLTEEAIEKILKAPYYAKERAYLGGFGPIDIKVVNPLNVPKGDFIVGIVDQSNNPEKRDSLSSTESRWYIKHAQTGVTKYADTTLSYNNEQIFEEWGLSLRLSQSIKPGNTNSLTDGSNGYITSEIIFNNPANQWLNGIIDEQVANYVPFNWIRSGTNGEKANPAFGSAELHDFVSGNAPVDPRKNFSNIIDAKWAPYALAAKFVTTDKGKLPSFGPGWAGTNNTGFYSSDNTLSDLSSVQIVFTADKSKWSRCIVLELGEDDYLNIGGAKKFEIRKSPSVGKNGTPDGTGNGMGWFPGYAINLETGERLNILFGEDSSLPGENGTDMVWNPTSTYFNEFGRPVFGGKHYVYVAGAIRKSPGGAFYEGPRYDECASYASLLQAGGAIDKRKVFSQFMYTSMAMLAPGSQLRDAYNGIVPNDVTIRIHVKKPYASFSIDGVVSNDSMPLFKFNTDGISATTSNELTKAMRNKILDKVSIVPNPYYAYSQYEDPGNQLDGRIKITNLPPKCLIQIYTQDGVIVRTIRKDDPTTTSVFWDLKNDAKAPTASGIYLVHIKADDIGEERIIKWFGIMRPVDYDSF